MALYHNTHDETAFTNCNLEPQDLDSDEEPSSSTTIELSNEEDDASILESAVESDVESDVSVSDAELEKCEDPDDNTSVGERIIGSGLCASEIYWKEISSTHCSCCRGK